MRASNTITTVIVIAAVLIVAYGVGLLIHQARVGHVQPSPQAEANDVQAEQLTAESAPATGPGQKKDTPEKRAKIKETRAEILQKMESATEEQKRQFAEQVRERVGSRRTKRLSVEPNAGQTGVEPNAAGQR